MRPRRRTFVRTAALASGGAWLTRGIRLLRAKPLGLAPGVQLWSVREELKANPEGTLRRLATIGYSEVELFETPKAPRESRKRVEDAGLKCVSGHFELKDPATIAAAQELGSIPRASNCYTSRIWCRAIMSRQPSTPRTKTPTQKLASGPSIGRSCLRQRVITGT